MAPGAKVRENSSGRSSVTGMGHNVPSANRIDEHTDS